MGNETFYWDGLISYVVICYYYFIQKSSKFGRSGDGKQKESGKISVRRTKCFRTSLYKGFLK